MSLQKAPFQNVILLDDDFTVNYINRFWVEQYQLGEHIVAFTNAWDALRFIEGNNMVFDPQNPAPNLLIVDIKMPEMDGFEFLRRLEHLDWLLHSRTFVYILTTSMANTDRVLANQFQLKGYLQKPLTGEMVMNIIQTAELSTRQGN